MDSDHNLKIISFNCGGLSSVKVSKNKHFLDTVHCREMYPSSTGKPPKRQLVPWWNSDCTMAIQGRKNALNIFLKKTSPVNLAIYRSLETETKRVIYQAKTQNWKEFCDSIKTNGLNSRFLE